MSVRYGFVLVMFALIGCSKGEPKVAPVSGTVTLDGKPLTDGTIIFKTVATGGFESLPVKDGKFAGNVEVGDRRVEINSYKTVDLKDNQMGGAVHVNQIPDRYNTNSAVTATVKPQGGNEFTFEVKSK